MNFSDIEILPKTFELLKVYEKLKKMERQPHTALISKSVFFNAMCGSGYSIATDEERAQFISKLEMLGEDTSWIEYRTNAERDARLEKRIREKKAKQEAIRGGFKQAGLVHVHTPKQLGEITEKKKEMLNSDKLIQQHQVQFSEKEIQRQKDWEEFNKSLPSGSIFAQEGR